MSLPPALAEAVARVEKERDNDLRAADYCRDNDRGEEALSRQLDADAKSLLLSAVASLPTREQMTIPEMIKVLQAAGYTVIK